MKKYNRIKKLNVQKEINKIIKKLNTQKEIDKIISNSRLIAKYKNLDIYITMEQSYRFIESRTQKLVLSSTVDNISEVLARILYGSPDAEVNDVQYFRIYKKEQEQIPYILAEMYDRHSIIKTPEKEWYSYNKYSKKLEIIDNPEMLNILNMIIIGG